MSGKSVIGSIIGSVLISAIITSALMYFALPYLFPTISEENLVIQSKYEEWDTPAYIYDDEMGNFKKMTDTEIEIEIQEDSQIAVLFTAMALLSVGPTFDVRNSYEIALVVEDAGNKTIMVVYFDSGGATGAWREVSYDLNINYVTEPLDDGEYTVEVYWRSTWDASGTNSLSVAHSPSYEYKRSLWVQELRSD